MSSFNPPFMPSQFPFTRVVPLHGVNAIGRAAQDGDQEMFNRGAAILQGGRGFRAITPVQTISSMSVFVGIIQPQGPNDESDFSGPIYWIKSGFAQQQQNDDYSKPVNPQADTSAEMFWCTATNLLETVVNSGSTTVKGTHQLSAGRAVLIFKLKDTRITTDGSSTNPPIDQFVFADAVDCLTFKITSNAAGMEKYNGQSYTPKQGDVSPSSDLSESDLGTSSGFEDCLILNLPALGVSNTGHDVTASANTFSVYGFGRWVSTNSDGIKVIEAMEFYVACDSGGGDSGGASPGFMGM